MRNRVIARVVTMLVVAGATCTAVLAVGLATDRWRVVPVLTGSMAPAFGAGDLVVTGPRPAATIAAGDVIVFHAPSDGRLTVHRVIEVVEPGPYPVVRTQGDAATTPDPWLIRLQDDRAWTVHRVIPAVGRPLLWSDRAAVRLGLLATSVGVLVLLGLHRIWRPPREVLRAA